MSHAHRRSLRLTNRRRKLPERQGLTTQECDAVIAAAMAPNHRGPTLREQIKRYRRFTSVRQRIYFHRVEHRYRPPEPPPIALDRTHLPVFAMMMRKRGA